MSFYFNELESNRFKLSIFRWDVQKLTDIKSDFNSLLLKRPDIIIASADLKQLHELNELLNDYPSYIGDVRVMYETNIENFDFNQKHVSALTLHKCSASDLHYINLMIDIMFKMRPIHYSFNPLLNDWSLILECYKDWIKRNFEKDGVTYILKMGAENVGFFTAEIKGDLADGILAGILPEYEARGWYSEMYNYFIPQIGKILNIKRIRTVTQVQNKAAIKQWQEAGWKFKSSSITFHLNVLLNSLRSSHEAKSNLNLWKQTKTRSLLEPGIYTSTQQCLWSDNKVFLEVEDNGEQAILRYFKN